MALPGNKPGNYVPPAPNTTILVTPNYTTTYGFGPLPQVGQQEYQVGAGDNDAVAAFLTWDEVVVIYIRGPSDNGRYRITFAANDVLLIEACTLADARTQGYRLLQEIFGGPTLQTKAGDIIKTDGTVLVQP